MRSVVNTDELVEVGLMAKSVDLPNFNVQTKVYNAYNRKNIAQERINYDPVRMTFHDDSADIVRNFWQRYYEFHYRDSDHGDQLGNPVYSAGHKYQKRQQSAWGFSPLVASNESQVNYIASIRIYSLHQKSFSSYTLINPMIKEFKHGEHQQGEYGLLEQSMTVEYEAVLYDSGPVSRGTVIGWNHAHYDNTLSPLKPAGGGTTSILGPGGLIDSVTSGEGDMFTAALAAARVGDNWKNVNLKSVASEEFQTLARNILQGQNTRSEIFAPTGASVTEALSAARNNAQQNK
jgi:hypothetical protein